MSDELWVLKRKATLFRILANERAQALSGGIGTEVRDTFCDTLAEFAEAVARLAERIEAGSPTPTSQGEE